MQAARAALEPALGANVPQECLQALPRVLACSPYAADCLARYPGILAGLTAAGRLTRASRSGELAALLATEAPPDLDEEEFQRRLRCFSGIASSSVSSGAI